MNFQCMAEAVAIWFNTHDIKLLSLKATRFNPLAISLKLSATRFNPSAISLNLSAIRFNPLAISLKLSATRFNPSDNLFIHQKVYGALQQLAGFVIHHGQS